MAQLHYNDPEYLKERQNAKPLSLQENEKVIRYLNKALADKNKHYNTFKLLQRFIYNYEKMQYREIINSNVEYEIVESKMNSDDC